MKTNNFTLKVLGWWIISLLLSIDAFSQCAGTQSVIVAPLPINGTYAPSTTVQFCYTMNGYNQIGANWIDGFDLNLGAGWDLSTLVPISSPNSCDGNGQWDFYNSISSTNTGLAFGPGFFYDRFILDGNPGNDFGDWTLSGGCSWSFCFKITSLPACNTMDLSIFVTAIGDGTSGSWVNQSCPGVPYQLMSATCAFACNLDLTYVISNPTCYGACNGTIIIQMDSGVAPLATAWSTGNGNNLCNGSYSITTTDANGCSFDTTITLIQPDSLWGTLTFDSILCNGDMNASATFIPQGGTPPYLIVWYPMGNVGTSQTGLGGGTYTISMTDSASCPQLPPLLMNNYNDTFTIFEPEALVDSFYTINEMCPEANNGQALVQAYGGILPYSYNWFQNPKTGLDTGTYTVTITDANGCSISDSGVVMSDPLFEFEACCDTTIHTDETVIIYSTNITNYNYNWSSGDNSYYSIVSPIMTTTYYIWVSNGQGCSYMDSVIVTVLPTDYFYIPNVFSPNNDGINDTFFPIVGEIIKINSFRIYNRWGQLVYDNAIKYNWNGYYNGKECQIGVYIYYISYSLYDKTIFKKGDVTLIK